MQLQIFIATILLALACIWTSLIYETFSLEVFKRVLTLEHSGEYYRLAAKRSELQKHLARGALSSSAFGEQMKFCEEADESEAAQVSAADALAPEASAPIRLSAASVEIEISPVGSATAAKIDHDPQKLPSPVITAIATVCDSEQPTKKRSSVSSQSSYLIFAKEHRKIVIDANPTMAVSDVAKACAAAWKELSEKERAEWKPSA